MNLLEETIKFVCAVLYFVYLKLTNKMPRCLVIYYHGVKKDHVPAFRRQMDYLARKCTVVKASEITTSRSNGSNPLVAITFDDAFVSVMENAVPILREYRLPAGIFVPAGNLGRPAQWEMPKNYSGENETVMNKELIAELDNDGFEIFSHSLSHPKLTEIPDDRLEEELIGSKHALEKIIGHEVSAISYPNGAFDERVYNATQKAGYKFGFTIEPNMINGRTDCLAIGRFSVLACDSTMKFKLEVSGAYQVCIHLKTFKQLLERFFKSL